MMGEFRQFAMKGNVVDLAVGVIIGAAFGRIVDSVVGDIFMPVIGAITGGLDFSNYFIPLSSAVTADSLVEAKKQGAVLAWGHFITIAINFLIIAGVLFFAPVRPNASPELYDRGEVRVNGTRVASAGALRDAGLEPVALAAKEGLALVNGTDGMLAMACLAIHDLERVLDMLAWAPM